MLSHRCRIRSVPSSLKTLALFAALAPLAPHASDQFLPSHPVGGRDQSPKGALQSGAPAIASPLPFLTAYEASHPPSARCWR